MFIVLIWNTPSDVQLLTAYNGFAKTFADRQQAEDFMFKQEVSFHYQIVELKGE